MKGERGYIGIVVLAAVVLVGCRRTTGTLAAKQDNDTTAVEDILTAQQRAAQAENELIAYVKTSPDQWVQHEFGWWYRYTHKSEQHTESAGLPHAIDTCCLIHEKVYSLDGTFLVDAVREFDSNATGSRTEPFAYRMMLSELTPEDTVVMLMPWTVAYSKRGRDHVPPYTNIRVLLTLHTEPFTDVPIIEDSISNNEL